MKRTLLILAALPVLAMTKMMAPSNVPVSRLIQNVELNLKREPKNADLIFVLARLHSLAYAQGKKETQVYWDSRTAEGVDQNGAFHFAPWVPLKVIREAKAQRLTDSELGHLKMSFNLYGKVIEFQPDKSLAKLGRGWISEEAAKFSTQTFGFVTGKTMSKTAYRDLAAKYYRDIVSSYKAKSATEHRWGWDSEEPAYEAAQNLQRMFKEGLTPRSGEANELKKLITEYEARPLVMSPIIFPVDGAEPTELLSKNATATFDIAADGITRNWEWITPKAAFLAWDPAGSGKITSGEQLFGNRTFNMFFTDGYAALATLDDNLDGWLTKKEMKGIAVWHDKNANGISDEGEVRPIETWNVEAIRVKSSGQRAGMIEAEKGLRFTNGRTQPTYDWWPSSKN